MSAPSLVIKRTVQLAKRALPTPMFKSLTSVYDTVAYLGFRLPPRQMRTWISPAWLDFHKTGRDQVEFFVEVAGLQRSDRFLDIACGIGRLAIPLTTFLNGKGSYSGFDINEELISWCNKKIALKNPNFSFTVADVASFLHPDRPTPVGQYKFPYDDDSFDFAYAGSIFTHLLPDGAVNYLKQTARVLRPGGRLVATWLVYNKRSVKLTTTDENLNKNWKWDHGDYRLKSEDSPEQSVAYDEGKIRQMYADARFEILEPFRTDATYNSARIPNEREVGQHLYYALCVIAVRPQAQV